MPPKVQGNATLPNGHALAGANRDDWLALAPAARASIVAALERTAANPPRRAWTVEKASGRNCGPPSFTVDYARLDGPGGVSPALLLRQEARRAADEAAARAAEADPSFRRPRRLRFPPGQDPSLCLGGSRQYAPIEIAVSSAGGSAQFQAHVHQLRRPRPTGTSAFTLPAAPPPEDERAEARGQRERCVHRLTAPRLSPADAAVLKAKTRAPRLDFSANSASWPDTGGSIWSPASDGDGRGEAEQEQEQQQQQLGGGDHIGGGGIAAASFRGAASSADGGPNDGWPDDRKALGGGRAHSGDWRGGGGGGDDDGGDGAAAAAAAAAAAGGQEGEEGAAAVAWDDQVRMDRENERLRRKAEARAFRRAGGYEQRGFPLMRPVHPRRAGASPLQRALRHYGGGEAVGSGGGGGVPRRMRFEHVAYVLPVSPRKKKTKKQEVEEEEEEEEKEPAAAAGAEPGVRPNGASTAAGGSDAQAAESAEAGGADGGHGGGSGADGLGAPLLASPIHIVARPRTRIVTGAVPVLLSKLERRGARQSKPVDSWLIWRQPRVQGT
jgi:hypothetical protein